ncbi:MAG: hypothetical protein OXC44_01315 [Proteobacteria bacterium]|nr:hypothetical protein [Pseudomonadota bacterium]
MNTKTNNNITVLPPPRTYSHYLKIFFASFFTFNLFLFSISCNDGTPVTRENSDYTADLNNTQNTDDNTESDITQEHSALIAALKNETSGNTNNYNFRSTLLNQNSDISSSSSSSFSSSSSASLPKCETNKTCYSYDTDENRISIKFIPKRWHSGYSTPGFTISWSANSDAVSCKCAFSIRGLEIDIKYKVNDQVQSKYTNLDKGSVAIAKSWISLNHATFAHDGFFEKALQEAAEDDPDSVELIFSIYITGIRPSITLIVDNQTTRLLANHAKYNAFKSFTPHERFYTSTTIRNVEDQKLLATFAQNFIEAVGLWDMSE